MKYFQTFKNKLLNLLGMKKQTVLEFKKNRIDFVSIPENLDKLETAKMFLEALRKQGWTVTDKKGLLDKSNE